jgi:hypothetical protein
VRGSRLRAGRDGVRLSSSSARSVSTGTRMTSWRDTALFRATTSFTADNEEPPRSKKSSRLPIWSLATPSTVAQAVASRCSAGVRGASTSASASLSAQASVVNAILSILLLAVSGSCSITRRRWAPCSGAATRPAAAATVVLRAAVRRRRRRRGACFRGRVRRRRRSRRARPGPEGGCSRSRRSRSGIRRS